MKQFLSALLVVVMVAALAVPALAVDAGPSPNSKYVQPYGHGFPITFIGSAEIINNNQLPKVGGSNLKADDDQTIGFTVYDANGNEVTTIQVSYKSIFDLPANDPNRVLVQDALDKGLVGTQAVAATLFYLGGDLLNSFFASQYEGEYFTFKMDFSALTTFAVNPEFWFYNSVTGKWDKAVGERVGNTITFKVTTTHSCPMIVTIDGYESYYSRFVGKKVTSPDTLEVVNSVNFSNVVSLLGTAGVSKKHN